MILNDCPVGSVVRLVSICGDDVYIDYLKGNFVVSMDAMGRKYIVDGNGTRRHDMGGDKYYQFEIVTTAPYVSTITLNNKTYKLTPHTERQQITIDGVVYDMEEIGQCLRLEIKLR